VGIQEVDIHRWWAIQITWRNVKLHSKSSNLDIMTLLWHS
jgi:hypothetical protein